MHITVESFEGPLDYLLHLIQKNEIDIYTIQIIAILEQLIEVKLEESADCITLVAALILMKSKMLLPKQERSLQSIEEESLDPRFEVIHQLLEYCQLKEVGKQLIIKEQEQQAFFPRGSQPLPDMPKTLGIEHLTLKHLSQLLEQTAKKCSQKIKVIQEELWKVSDKIDYLRNLAINRENIPFSFLFGTEYSREERVATFLALLELIKLGELRVESKV